MICNSGDPMSLRHPIINNLRFVTNSRWGICITHDLRFVTHSKWVIGDKLKKSCMHASTRSITNSCQRTITRRVVYACVSANIHEESCMHHELISESDYTITPTLWKHHELISEKEYTKSRACLPHCEPKTFHELNHFRTSVILLNITNSWSRLKHSKKILSMHSLSHLSQTLRIVCLCICASHVQPIAFGVSFNLNLQSQSPWSLFNGTWCKKTWELDHRLRFENEEMTLHLQ